MTLSNFELDSDKNLSKENHSDKSEPPSPIHVSNAGPHSKDMFCQNGKNFKQTILDKKYWIHIHFPNGTTSRAVLSEEQTFKDFLKGLNRLQPYHDKINQMTLWHMDFDVENKEYKTNFFKGTIPFSSKAYDYIGKHLNFVPIDDKIKKDMKYNKAKHRWIKVGLLDFHRFQKACKICCRFTAVLV